jgi:hypothetical protein
LAPIQIGDISTQQTEQSTANTNFPRESFRLVIETSELQAGKHFFTSLEPTRESESLLDHSEKTSTSRVALIHSHQQMFLIQSEQKRQEHDSHFILADASMRITLRHLRQNVRCSNRANLRSSANVFLNSGVISKYYSSRRTAIPKARERNQALNNGKTTIRMCF